MNTATEDGREFRRLCREGMLFEVQEWIRAGRGQPCGGRCEQSPVALAAGKGCHSLVVLLLTHGTSQDNLDAALAAAAAGGHLEVCRLLMSRGASLKRVSAADVVRCPNPDAAGFLVSAGLDIETGTPLANALVYESEEALAFLRRWRRRSKAVRLQGAMALKYFVMCEEVWRVTRIMKAGADPRLRVPGMNHHAQKNERWHFTALEMAVMSGTFPMLLRLGVRKSDDGHELLDCACLGIDRAKFMHIVRRTGCRINDQPDGGSSLLHECIRKLGADQYDHLPWTRRSAEQAWEVTKELVAMGARWIPEKSSLRDVRASLNYAGPYVGLELVRLLTKHKAVSSETLFDVFRTPTIRRAMGQNMELISDLMGRT